MPVKLLMLVWSVNWTPQSDYRAECVVLFLKKIVLYLETVLIPVKFVIFGEPRKFSKLQLLPLLQRLYLICRLTFTIYANKMAGCYLLSTRACTMPSQGDDLVLFPNFPSPAFITYMIFSWTVIWQMDISAEDNFRGRVMNA